MRMCNKALLVWPALQHCLLVMAKKPPTVLPSVIR